MGSEGHEPDRLRELTKLHDQGVLSDQEYEAATRRVVAKPPSEAARSTEGGSAPPRDLKSRLIQRREIQVGIGVTLVVLALVLFASLRGGGAETGTAGQASGTHPAPAQEACYGTVSHWMSVMATETETQIGDTRNMFGEAYVRYGTATGDTTLAHEVGELTLRAALDQAMYDTGTLSKDEFDTRLEEIWSTCERADIQGFVSSLNGALGGSVLHSDATSIDQTGDI